MIIISALSSRSYHEIAGRAENESGMAADSANSSIDSNFIVFGGPTALHFLASSAAGVAT